MSDAVGHVDEADAHADGECALVRDEMEVRDCLPQVLGNARGVLDRAVLEQHAELVATEPRQRVAFAQALLQHGADLPHELVAGRMAAGVVDDLELVEVEIHHRVMPALLARAGERAVQAMLELAPVDESGQRIVAGLVGQLGGELALAAHVVQHQHDAGDRCPRGRGSAQRTGRWRSRRRRAAAARRWCHAHRRVLAQHARDRVWPRAARRLIEHASTRW